MLYVNRASISAWETFNIVDQPGGYVAIRAVRNNMYIDVTDAGNLTPTATTVTDSCLFTLVVPPGGNLTMSS